MRMILHQLKVKSDGIPTMSNNTSDIITLIDLAAHQHHTITQLPINFPFKYLGSESNLLGTTKHQFNSSKKHALKGVRIISIAVK